MKINRKTVLSTAAVLGVAALIAGGTIAYFTDHDSLTNEFTVGSVDIELVESYLHRTNAGQANNTTSGRLNWSTDIYPLEGVAGTAAENYSENEVTDDVGNVWDRAYYTDAQIIANSDYCADHDNDTTYLFSDVCADVTNKDAYTNYREANNAESLVPSTSIKKMPYVINTGDSDAYVRVRVLIPSFMGVLGTNGKYSFPVFSPMYTDSARIHATTNPEGEFPKEVTRDDGKSYLQYTFVYNDALKPGKMTFWNVWGDIGIKSQATSEQIQALINAVNDFDASKDFDVIIEADAIQATGFNDATAAFEEYDKTTPTAGQWTPNTAYTE
ncbi:SipW-dependent-type signal peptide-containing protein [Candidatus Saccharibacteria bacterium]|nr:SipW-dependent-type signal peptide-containing protein [Candidatus Saccharibacteria bacterium]